jgi:hypothetical protein
MQNLGSSSRTEAELWTTHPVWMLPSYYCNVAIAGQNVKRGGAGRGGAGYFELAATLDD